MHLARGFQSALGKGPIEKTQGRITFGARGAHPRIDSISATITLSVPVVSASCTCALTSVNQSAVPEKHTASISPTGLSHDHCSTHSGHFNNGNQRHCTALYGAVRHCSIRKATPKPYLLLKPCDTQRYSTVPFGSQRYLTDSAEQKGT